MEITEKEKEFVYDTPNLSTLFGVAIDEYIRIKNGKSPGVKLNMNIWHFYIESKDVCEVCLAGAVMDGVLGADRKEPLKPMCFVRAISNRLYAIDDLRFGHVDLAYDHLFKGGMDSDNYLTFDNSIYSGFKLGVKMPEGGYETPCLDENLTAWKNLEANLGYCERLGGQLKPLFN